MRRFSTKSAFVWVFKWSDWLVWTVLSLRVPAPPLNFSSFLNLNPHLPPIGKISVGPTLNFHLVFSISSSPWWLKLQIPIKWGVCDTVMKWNAYLSKIDTDKQIDKLTYKTSNINPNHLQYSLTKVIIILITESTGFILSQSDFSVKIKGCTELVQVERNYFRLLQRDVESGTHIGS